MIKVKDIYDFIDEIAPFKTAMDFDNCGLLVGNLDDEVKKVLLSLDINKNVCDEAKEKGANLIISHHPVIFKPLKNLNFESAVSKLIKYGINAICAHTNLDIANEGVNYYLAKSLNLSNLSSLFLENSCSLGLIGQLDTQLEAKEFAKFVKKSLKCNGLRYTQVERKIRKVAVCSGSGGNLIDYAFKNNVDAFVTGEIKHSDIIKANEYQICVVDAGHFKTENLVLEPLKLKLEDKFKSINFELSMRFTDNVMYL